jgi:hypothetical protein
MNALLLLSRWLFPIRIQTPSRGGFRTPLAATELERPWNAPLGIVRSVRDTDERWSAMRGTDQHPEKVRSARTVIERLSNLPTSDRERSH